MPGNRIKRRDNRERAKAHVDMHLSDHVVSNIFAASEKTFAFQYRDKNNSSRYMLSIAWMPGHLFVGGDMGDVTFTYYHALYTIDDAIEWFTRNADVSYILSKTGKKQVIDRDQTIDTVTEDKATRLREERSYRTSKEERAKISEKYDELIDDLRGCNEHSIPRRIYESGLYDDYYGTYDYEYGDILLVLAAQQALKAFAQETQAISEKKVPA